jgi:hypothetical protein
LNGNAELSVSGQIWALRGGRLAASAGMAGDLDVAANALAVAKRLQPSLSIKWVEKYHSIVRARDRLMYIERLRAAGLE